MLCPEVFNFKAPESNFQSEKVDEELCLRKIRDFNFVHSITVILPDTLSIPDSFGFELTNSDYYKINSLKIDELVKPAFVQNFINSGNVNFLSINTRIDCDDCLAVTSCGKLILNLTKTTFQTFGLDGEVSHFHKRSKDKYIVTIDLKTECIKPNKKFYERVKTCLQKLKFNVILQWEPPKNNVCPSSIAKYFFDMGFQVKLCKIKKESETVFDVKVPVINNLDEFDQYESSRFVEWLGTIMINGSEEDNSNYLSSYTAPEPTVHLGQVRTLRWRGFFNTGKLVEFLKEVRLKYGNSQFWKAVYFQGFSDSPVVWGSNEHHFYTNGDSGGVVIMNQKQTIFCSQKCSNKYYK